MPVPIGLVGENPEKPENNNCMDLSFLADNLINNTKKAGFISSNVANKDASMLMKIWLNASKIDKETFDVDKMEITNNDLLRLKSRGLLSGGTKRIKITPKGKTVVSTMTLGENNKFLEKKQNKTYTEILASMKKSNEDGYRIPKFASTSCVLNLKGTK